MPAPLTPTNFSAQAGDSSVYLSWDNSVGATSYPLYRSTDNVTFTLLTSPVINSYTDSAVTEGVQYFYKVAASNGEVSAQSASASAVPMVIGNVSLVSVRNQVLQRCDRVGSQFVDMVALNQFITGSYKELYDILKQKFGDDYFVATPYSYTTDGGSQLYPLPPDFYALLGVEVALNPNDPNSWVTLRKFEFIQRNLWNYPNVYTFYGITNLRYRLNGNNLMIVPIASANQTIRIWYVPRPAVLVKDTDILDGISGWEEYVIVDACIKYLIKEESLEQAQAFASQKAALIKRIEEAAENRDIGEPETVSDSKRRNFSWSDDNGGYNW
jgi:hypothetical protein